MLNARFPEIFADELAEIMLGYPISKLTFIAVKKFGTDGIIEKDQVLTLSIPTQSLLDACQMVLDNANRNQDFILNGASTSEGKLLKLLKNEAVSKTKTSTVEKKPTKATKAIKS
ncbi:MAG: hypothetical protein ABIR84_13355 [Candidatus Nitrotoga sp.]